MQSESQSQQTLEVFFSYSHKDEELRDRLETHLSILKRQKIISAWHDRQIGAGKEWSGKISEQLEKAQIILLLVSADFVASDYCYDIEMKRALELHEAKEARVIPIILKPVDWQGAPFSKLQALPKNGKPVTSWANNDEAFLDIAKGIRSVIEKFAGQKEKAVKSVIHPEATSLILTALVTGAAAAAKDTASQAIKDAYTGLKDLILKRLTDKPEAEMALTQHEKKPEIWQEPLKDALSVTGANQDEEIIRQARRVVMLINPQQASQKNYKIQIGQGKGIVIGDNAQVTQTFSDD